MRIEVVSPPTPLSRLHLPTVVVVVVVENLAPIRDIVKLTPPSLNAPYRMAALDRRRRPDRRRHPLFTRGSPVAGEHPQERCQPQSW